MNVMLAIVQDSRSPKESELAAVLTDVQWELADLLETAQRLSQCCRCSQTLPRGMHVYESHSETLSWHLLLSAHSMANVALSGPGYCHGQSHETSDQQQVTFADRAIDSRRWPGLLCHALAASFRLPTCPWT